MGTPFFILILMCFALILITLLKPIKTCFDQTKCIGKVMVYIKTQLMWNFTLRFLSETYMIVTICCMINLNYMHFNDLAMSISSVFTLIFTVVITAFPIYIGLFMEINWNVLQKPITKTKVGVMYAGLALHRGKSIIAYPVLFLVRRICMSLFIITMAEYPVF